MTASITQTATQYERPETLEDAARLKAQHPSYLVIAGGTDVMVSATHKDEPTGIIDIFHIATCRDISETSDGISIGALATYSQIINSPLIKSRVPILHLASKEVGALQIQNRGTLGGNIATSSPVGDTLPVLLACDASVELVSGKQGAEARLIPYNSFCTGYRKNEIGADELVSRVHIPSERLSSFMFWRKVGTRRAQSISKVMIAASALPSQNKGAGVVQGVRVAMGAVADRPVRLLEVEALLEGRRPSPALADEALAITQRSIKPIDDIRSNANYRRTTAGRLVRRFVLELVNEFETSASKD